MVHHHVMVMVVLWSGSTGPHGWWTATPQDEWTDEKLAEVVSKKHAGNTDTDIICKNFLEALENNKYGKLGRGGAELVPRLVLGVP